MGVIGEALQNIKNYLSLASFMDLIDVAIVAFVIYKLMVLVRKSTAAQVLKGIALLVVMLALSGLLGLNVIRYILSATMQVGLLAVIIMFQPELRKMLEQVGASRFPKLFGRDAIGDAPGAERVIAQVVSACSTFSQQKTGALIVFERRVLLSDLAKTGTIINADVSSMLIKNIFFKNAALHDGAMIIRENRVLAAGCVLPNSANANLSRDLGTRHRAGVGASEASDAIVVVVSEETGTISVAVGGMLKRHLNTETLAALLRKELLPSSDQSAAKGVKNKVKRAALKVRGAASRLFGKKRKEAAAVEPKPPRASGKDDGNGVSSK